MSAESYEVPEPILNSPFCEPAKYWNLEEGRAPVQMIGRRPAGYFYRDPKVPTVTGDGEHSARGQWMPLELVNLIRERMTGWRSQKYPGVSRTTLELLTYWQRMDGNIGCSLPSWKRPKRLYS